MKNGLCAKHTSSFPVAIAVGIAMLSATTVHAGRGHVQTQQNPQHRFNNNQEHSAYCQAKAAEAITGSRQPSLGLTANINVAAAEARRFNDSDFSDLGEPMEPLVFCPNTVGATAIDIPDSIGTAHKTLAGVGDESWLRAAAANEAAQNANARLGQSILRSMRENAAREDEAWQHAPKACPAPIAACDNTQKVALSTDSGTIATKPTSVSLFMWSVIVVALVFLVMRVASSRRNTQAKCATATAFRSIAKSEVSSITACGTLTVSDFPAKDAAIRSTPSFQSNSQEFDFTSLGR